MKNNRGISLIVLVITIIVMVILAGAIVLTLNNSGIIGKASEAVKATNEANLKEMGNVYLGEYIIKTNNGEIDETQMNNSQYVKSRMLESGVAADIVATMAVTEDNEVLVGLTPIAAKLVDARVPVGATIAGYDISGNETSYTTDGKEYTFNDDDNKANTEPQPQTVNVAADVSWTYMGVSNDGEALIVLDLDDSTVQDADASAVYSTMALGGAGGYNNGVNALNTVCDKLYSTSKGKARSINYDDILKLLEYNGPKAQYAVQVTTSKTQEVKVDNIKTIEEYFVDSPQALAQLTGEHGFTPDGTDITKHNVNYLWIKKNDANDAKYIKGDEEALKIVFLGGVPKKADGTAGADGLDINYWIADTSVRLTYSDYPTISKYPQVTYGVRRGNGTNISAYTLTYAWTSGTTIIGNGHGEDGKVVLRPVVELAGDLDFEYATGVLTLK